MTAPETIETIETRFVTREAWLNALVEVITPWYEDLGLTVPPVRISVGFTSKGARSTRIGECWHPAAVADGVPAIFIHPGIGDPVEVAGIVVHEVIHACLGPGAKHGPQFRRPAVALGLQGRMTATTSGPDLLARLAPVLDTLGPYPHAAVRSTGGSSNGPKQTTRMLKVECPECGYLVRTTQKWLDLGTPSCPVDETVMEAS